MRRTHRFASCISSQGGTFVEIDGAPSSGLARWDGAQWTNFATITPGSNFFGGNVFALHDGGAELLVAGNIAAVDGVPVNGIAAWDGASWTDRGGGLDADASVRGLVMYHGDLIASGGVSLSGTYGVARFDGATWSALGSGVQPWDLFGNKIFGDALNGRLYLGGNIGSAGGKTSSFIAQWTDVATGVGESIASVSATLSVSPNPIAAGTTIRWVQARDAVVALDVFDTAGRRITRLASEARAAGAQSFSWDGRDSQGVPVTSGVYFVRLVAEDVKEVSKVVIAP